MVFLNSVSEIHYFIPTDRTFFELFYFFQFLMTITPTIDNPEDPRVTFTAKTIQRVGISGLALMNYVALVMMKALKPKYVLLAQLKRK